MCRRFPVSDKEVSMQELSQVWTFHKFMLSEETSFFKAKETQGPYVTCGSSFDM